MSKRVNLYIQDEQLWNSFISLVGRGNVSKWIENTIRPLVDNSDLATSYKQMALDSSREAEAEEWVHNTFDGVPHESW